MIKFTLTRQQTYSKLVFKSISCTKPSELKIWTSILVPKIPKHTKKKTFYHPQGFKLVFGTYTEWILNTDKKHNKTYQIVANRQLQRQNTQSQLFFMLYTSFRFKDWDVNFNSKNLNTPKMDKSATTPKTAYQIIDEQTDLII